MAICKPRETEEGAAGPPVSIDMPRVPPYAHIPTHHSSHADFITLNSLPFCFFFYDRVLLASEMAGDSWGWRRRVSVLVFRVRIQGGGAIWDVI
jgi:hypothetical protein